MLRTRSPLDWPKPLAFDLHVLSMPPTFILSQDQTLRENLLLTSVLEDIYLTLFWAYLPCPTLWLLSFSITFLLVRFLRLLAATRSLALFLVLSSLSIFEIFKVLATRLTFAEN